MTKKEFNRIRTAAYTAALEIPEVAEALACTGWCSIYKISDHKQSKIMVITHLTQLNDLVFAEHGFDPAKVEIHKEMTLDRQTKCATF